MAASVLDVGHRLTFPAPYYLVDGPIEYVFNTVQGHVVINIDKVKITVLLSATRLRWYLPLTLLVYLTLRTVGTF